MFCSLQAEEESTQADVPPNKESKRVGGLVHAFPMMVGCPVPEPLQELPYKFVVVELNDTVCPTGISGHATM